MKEKLEPFQLIKRSTHFYFTDERGYLLGPIRNRELADFRLAYKMNDYYDSLRLEDASAQVISTPLANAPENQ